MKVLFVIDVFIDGGASNAMMGLLEGLQSYGVEAAIFTRSNFSTYSKVPVKSGDGNDLVDFISENKFDFIHWFRTNLPTLSHSYIQACRDRNFSSPFIFCTLCQVPNNHSFRLTVQELSFFNYFIFICKSALHHPYHTMIPDEMKTMIYFGTNHMSSISPKNNFNEEEIVFGRGSSLNKCPEDMIEIYLKASEGILSKFYIVGAGESSWIEKKIEDLHCSDRVKLIPHMSPEEWIRFLQSLDVYLYQLPEDAYSAIDATIQDAMLAEVPVVVYGPEGPKELIENGKSGFAADTKEAFIADAKKLAEGLSLRKEIGANGRAHILKNFAHEKTVAEYFNLYTNVKKNAAAHASIPLSYSLAYHLQEIRFIFINKMNALIKKIKV